MIKKYRGGNFLASVRRKMSSLTAWLALGNDPILTTLADGTRELVNSKGDNVASTSNGRLTANGTSEYLTVTKDITDMKTFLFDVSYDGSVNGAIFDTDMTYASSFTVRLEALQFRLYYADTGTPSSALWHDYLISDWSLVNRIGISFHSSGVYLSVNGVIVKSFLPKAVQVASSGLSYIMAERGLSSFGKASVSNLQVWSVPFSNSRFLFDYLEPEKAYQLAFAEEEANQYLEEVVIPPYNALDTTHLLITTANGAWTQSNFDEGTPYRHFYMEAGDYGTARVNLEAKGTERGEYTLSLHNGNDIHPASLLDAEQANCFFELRGNYWTIDRISFIDLDVGVTPSLRLINSASNNIINRWHCRGFKYGYQVYNRVGSWGMCNYNTIQNSYIHDQVDVLSGDAFDGIAMNLYAYGTDTIDTIGNKFINNDVCNSGDAFQATRTANNGDNTKNGEGTIVYNNRTWLTTDVYRDLDGTLNPLGEYSQTEEAIDLKFGSENPLNPMIIEKNIAHGFRAILKNGTGATCPTAFFSHFGVRNTKMNYNIASDGGGVVGLSSMENFECIGNISADAHLINPNDEGFLTAIALSDSVNGIVRNNVVARQIPSSSGSGDAIGSVGSANNSLDGNVLVGSKDLVIGATDTITNTWLYAHIGSDAGETTNVYATEAEAELRDFSYEYERYTTTPKIKTVSGVLTDTLSPHFGVAGYIPEEDMRIGKMIMLPLLEGTATPIEYVSNSVVDVSSFTDINASWNLASGLSTGLQKIYFNDDMTKADTMHISTDYNQIIAVVPTEAYTVKWTTSNNTTYELSTFTTNIDTNQMLSHMGVTDAEIKSIEGV